MQILTDTKCFSVSYALLMLMEVAMWSRMVFSRFKKGPVRWVFGKIRQLLGFKPAPKTPAPKGK